MHKSKGNVIEPDEIIKQGGAEMVRLWAASVDFTEDVRISATILERLTEAYHQSCAIPSATLWAICTISIPRGSRCRADGGDAGDRPLDSGALRGKP